MVLQDLINHFNIGGGQRFGQGGRGSNSKEITNVGDRTEEEHVVEEDRLA